MPDDKGMGEESHGAPFTQGIGAGLACCRCTPHCDQRLLGMVVHLRQGMLIDGEGKLSYFLWSEMECNCHRENISL